MFSWSGLFIACIISLALGLASAAVSHQSTSDARVMAAYTLAAFGAVAFTAAVVETLRAAPHLHGEVVDEIARLQSLLEEVSRDVPNLSGGIVQAIWSTTDEPVLGARMNFMAATVGVLNKGAGTIVQNWRAVFEIDGVTRDAVLLHTDNFVAVVAGKRLVIGQDDSIVEKCGSDPVERGQKRSGWIMFGFPGRSLEEIKSALITVYCQDYLGKECSFQFMGGPDLDHLKHVPGSGGQITSSGG